jgi:serine/threonine-protein phosphatase PGAM5
LAIRTLYLIRHGQYDPTDPTDHPLQGELSPLGKMQAGRIAKALAQVPITAIHYSTLRRAEQTALPLIAAFPEAKTYRVRRLWECIPHVAPDYAHIFTEFTPEHLVADAAHAEAAFEYYFKPTRGTDKHEAIVAHGNLIRYFICRALRVEAAAWFRMEIHNSSISRIKIYEGGGYVLVSYNETGHLTPKMRTDNMHTLD